MKTTLRGWVPAKDAPFGAEIPVELAAVSMSSGTELWITVMVGAVKVNVNARELAATIGAFQAAQVTPNWALGSVINGPEARNWWSNFPIKP
jgi:hypothetical protein